MSWSTSEQTVRLARPETGSSPPVKYFLLTVPRRCFFWGSFMLFLSCFYYAFVRVCLLMPCGHMLGKRWPLGSRLWCLIVKLSLSHWYPGSGVVLDCIDSWSLPSFYFEKKECQKIFDIKLYGNISIMTNFVKESSIMTLSPYCLICRRGPYKHSRNKQPRYNVLITTFRIHYLLGWSVNLWKLASGSKGW